MPKFGEWESNADREGHESQAALFAIIKTVEYLEKAYVQDLISAEEYTPACSKLIAQFKTVRHAVFPEGASPDPFLEKYGLRCPSAHHRLLVSGVPATIEHTGGTGGRVFPGSSHPNVDKTASDPHAEKRAAAEPHAVSVMRATQGFITAMDALRLEMSDVDQVFPLLSELLESLQSVPLLGDDVLGKVKARRWLSELNGRRAHERLSDEDARQLMFDLETAYDDFRAQLARM